MKNVLKLVLLSVVLSSLVVSCSSRNPSRSKSSLTGWNFNDPAYGGYSKVDYKKQKTPVGMVYIEGGTFVMGSVQDDVMSDWNTTPRRVEVRSFYMDESEVTNSEYLLYVQYTKDVFPPEQEQYKHIYESTLPDTLVWREGLGNTNWLVGSYFRHPAYAEYPVVGVSWLQANQYCKWRTDAVNLKTLMDKGVIKDIFKDDSLKFRGKDRFDTEAYLSDPYYLFNGDSTIYKKGLPDKRVAKKGSHHKKGSFTGRHITYSDGVFIEKYRLPTEAEWEFAAKANFQNREFNSEKGRNKYAWKGKYTTSSAKRQKGDQLANFKQGKGNYSGIAGWSSDGASIPAAVGSYPPNAYGLYDMSGNVAEWVADVYRPIIDTKLNDFNYFRGNAFTKKVIGENGKAVIAREGDIAYDTLENGKILPKYLPGSVKYIPIAKEDTYLRRNYTRADNSDLDDGDQESSRFYKADTTTYAKSPGVYNSPKKPEKKRDSLGNIIFKNKYDSKFRSTLISNRTRVYKGGSWRDRAYWLDPAQRRYLPEYMSTNYIGFRCASGKVGASVITRKKRRFPKFNLRRRSGAVNDM